MEVELAGLRNLANLASQPPHPAIRFIDEHGSSSAPEGTGCVLDHLPPMFRGRHMLQDLDAEHPCDRLGRFERLPNVTEQGYYIGELRLLDTGLHHPETGGRTVYDVGAAANGRV